MKYMLRIKLATLAVGTVLALTIQQASATIIPLGEGNPSNSGIQTETAFVQSLIDKYNSDPSKPDLPGLAGLTLQKFEVEDGGKEFSYTVPKECDFVYILEKWGGGQNVPVDTEVFYATGGTKFQDAAPLVIKGKNTKQLGLSHYMIWCGKREVPDSGSTLALLGLALLGTEALRRRVLHRA